MSEKVTAMIEEIKGLTVLELSELVHALEEEFGVSAAAMAAPAAGAAAPAAEEKTDFDVVLAGFDAAAKIKVYSAEKFFTYTKLGLPKPLRFRSIKPNSSSYRSSLVALLSAQHNALLTSSIVKMMNTRPCSSSQPFLADRLMRSSRMP